MKTQNTQKTHLFYFENSWKVADSKAQFDENSAFFFANL